VILNIDPVALAVGGFAVRWFGVLVLAGAGLGTGLAVRECKQQGLAAAPLLDALAWALPIGILFARAINIVGWWDYYLTHAGAMWQLNLEDGLSLWGGIVGGALVMAARLRRVRSRRRRLLDAAATGLLAAIAIGRVGEFLDGHGQGLPSDVPWATRYTNALSATPDFGVARHPAQLYDALVCVALLVLMSRMRRLPAGARAGLFLVGYGCARIVLGAVRLEPAFLFGLQIDQLLATSCVVFGIWYLVGVARRRGVQRIGPDVQRTDSLAA
jgi:phosphatidylglycerol:prolipoprotein diacylglycerol transferase